jgi:small subunit ribosomal protein S20
LATHKSAIKRHNQNLRRRARNRAVKTRIKNATKEVLDMLEANDADGAQKALREATITIDRAASKGVIHKNAASRKISRLSIKVHRLLAAS